MDTVGVTVTDVVTDAGGVMVVVAVAVRARVAVTSTVAVGIMVAVGVAVAVGIMGAVAVGVGVMTGETGVWQTHHEAWAEWSTHSVAVGASAETCFRAGYTYGVLAGATVGRDPREWRAAQLGAMAERDTHWRIWQALTESQFVPGEYPGMSVLRSPERSFRAGFSDGQICVRRVHPHMTRGDEQ